MRSTSLSRLLVVRSSVTRAKEGMTRRRIVTPRSPKPSGERVAKEMPFSAPLVKRIGMVT